MTTGPIEQPKRKRRRWRQFSLRTMFVLLTVMAVLLGLLSPSLVERRREQAVVRTIEAAGGRVTVYDYVPQFGATVFSAVLGSGIYMRVREVDLAGTSFKDADLEQFHQLTHLRTLSLSGTKVTDAGLPHLSRDANLESLDLSQTLISDAGLPCLKELSRLSRLNTQGTQVSYGALEELQKALPLASHLVQQRAIDEVVAGGGMVDPVGGQFQIDNATTIRFHGNRCGVDPRHLEHLPNLRSLHLMGTQVNGNMLSALESLPRLEELHLLHVQIANADLAHLRPLSRLKVLRLDWSGVDDDGLSNLASLSNLQELYLHEAAVTGLGFKHLEGLSQLRVLDLAGCQYIYDADLEQLHGLKRLRRVVLNKARVTAAGIAQLQKALPNAQIIVGEREQRRPWNFGLTSEFELPAEGEAAFWAGDYDTMAQVFRQFVSTQISSWQGYLWLGHAYQLSDQWREAVGAYKIAIAQLEREITSGQTSRGTAFWDYDRQEWVRLLLLVGRIELEELKDPAAAAETLAKGLRFAPEANRPIGEIASEMAIAVGELDSPLSARPFNQRLWSDLMYPLTTHRYLATAHEQLGNVEAALECWLRIRLCRLGYRVAMADTDPVHIAKLWSRLRDTSPLPPMPVFSVLSEQQPEVTLKPNAGQTRLTWWESNAWDTFAVVASPDRAVASLEITCTLDRKTDGSTAFFQCWADAASHYAAGKRRLLEYHWPKAAANKRETRTFKVDIPYDTNVLFIESPAKATSEIRLRATLRKRGDGADWPDAIPPSPKASYSPGNFPGSPFRPVSPGATGRASSERGTSSLARLPDGRFLLAFGENKITLAASEDGVAWEKPWEYSHNSIFPTGNPTMLVDDEGVIWMLYRSKRPGTDYFSTGYYYLWLTNSRDGRSWSTPKPVRTAEMLSNNTTAQMTRSPNGKYWIFLNDQVGSGNSPGAIRKLERLYVPIHSDRIPTGAHATFEANGRCHLVLAFEGSRRLVEYSRSDDMRLWTPPTTLFEHANSTVTLPQLLIDGDRLTLVYSTNQGGWMRRGTMQADGPHLTQAIHFANPEAGVHGSRFMQESDKIYLPLAGSPPGLLVSDVDDLLLGEFAAPPTN